MKKASWENGATTGLRDKYNREICVGDACQQPSGAITISTWRESEKVAISIKDTGVGIRPEQMDLLFQPFYTTKAEVKGTGLGLSICHGVIKNHQGEIRVESQPGKGAIFTVLLPVRGA